MGKKIPDLTGKMYGKLYIMGRRLRLHLKDKSSTTACASPTLQRKPIGSSTSAGSELHLG
jgi:hypothetical protein